jgi:hypothetical protein
MKNSNQIEQHKLSNKYTIYKIKYDSFYSKYSFIYLIKSDNTDLIFQNDLRFKMEIGDLMIFETKNFVEDQSEILDRIALVGSLSNDINEDVNKKSLI